MRRSRTLCKTLAGFLLPLLSSLGAWAMELPELIEHIKPGVVAVGAYNKTTNPQFSFRGTGFVVGDGLTIATNAHVVPPILDQERGNTSIAILWRDAKGGTQLRPARLSSRTVEHDLALLKIDGAALPTLTLHTCEKLREGQMIAFTGFPIGGALGFSPVTHRGMIAAITPIALPSPTSRQLNEKQIRRLKAGTFDILQLDATAYPGNSGSPVFDLSSGEVIGIINMVLIKSTRESALSQPSGISYALPVLLLQQLMQSEPK